MLTVTPSGSDLVVTGPTSPVTVHTAALASGSGVAVEWTGVQIAAADFLTSVAGTWSAWSGYLSYSTANGSDTYGSYLDLTISGKQTLGTQATVVVVLRFYDGKPTFEARIATQGGWGSVTRVNLNLTFTSTQARWYTTGAPYIFGWEANGGAGGQTYFGDWSSNWSAVYLNQLDLTGFGNATNGISGFSGMPGVTAEAAGVWPYVDYANGVLYDTVFEYKSTSTVLYARCTTATSGFAITQDNGYPAMGEYSKWLQRNYYDAPTLNALRPVHTSNVDAWSPTQPNYSTAGVSSEIAAMKSQFPTLFGTQVKAYECDLSWFDALGQGTLKTGSGGWGSGSCANLPATVLAAGYDPYCWMSPTVETGAWSSGFASDTFINQSYVRFSGTNTKMWNPFSANGRAGIANLATQLVNLGWKGVRWDGVRMAPYIESAVLYYFRNAAKARAATLGTTFMIESTAAFLGPLVDILRINDYFGWPSGWDTNLERRAKVAIYAAPGKVIDCDLYGTLSPSSEPLANLQKQARIMFGYGRPILGYWTGADNMGSSVWNDTTIAGYFANYENFVANGGGVPTRTIVGDPDTANYSVRQTFPKGQTITYDAAADTLTFVGIAIYTDFSILEALPAPTVATYTDFSLLEAPVPAQVGAYTDFSILEALASTAATYTDFSILEAANTTPIPATETLRFYKHGGTGYFDVTSADVGGFSGLRFTQVRNDAGSLEGTFSATTIALFHAWANEAAKVEYWVGGVRQGVYVIDEYSTKWSDLSVTMKCVGVLAEGKTLYYTGDFIGVPVGVVLQSLCAAVPDWQWNSNLVAAGTYVVQNVSFTDKPVLTAMQEIADMAGLTFWIDANMALNVEVIPTAPNYTIQLPVGGTDGNGRDFDTTYAARDIINRLIIATPIGTFTFDDTASHATYGVKALKVEKSQFTSYAQAHDYATTYFLQHAQPPLEAGAIIDHDENVRPGMRAEVLGLSDGRLYQQVIVQRTYDLGSVFDELRLGAPPLALEEAPNDVMTSSTAVAPPVGVDQLPPFPSYFTGADTVGTPNAPQHVMAAMGFKALVLSWDLPPEAMWRSWEVYEGTSAGFTPDTTSGNFTNRVFLGQQTVMTIKHDVSTTPYFYQVCSVKTDGTRSPFVAVTNGGAGYIYGKVGNSELETITTANLIAGSALFGTIDASQVTVTNLDAGAITTGALTGLTVQTGASPNARAVMGPSVSNYRGASFSGPGLMFPSEDTTYETFHASICSYLTRDVSDSARRSTLSLATGVLNGRTAGWSYLEMKGKGYDNGQGSLTLYCAGSAFMSLGSNAATFTAMDINGNSAGYAHVYGLDFTNPSSRKLKRDISPLTWTLSPLDAVNAAEVCTYRYKMPKDSPVSAGIIAESLPEMVRNGEGYSMTQVLSLAFGAIQELTEQVEELTAEVRGKA